MASVAALVSGGVDSSVVVHLLKEQGIDPVLFYIRIGMEDEQGYVDCPSEEDIEISRYLAKKYGCKLEIVSLHEEYWENVVKYTIDAVAQGLTPNPDVMCNKLIKFGAFEQKYGKDFDLVATGHYANTTEVEGAKFLSTAKDKVKDQTYFLAQIEKTQLAKLCFPIGDYLKSEVREIAVKAKLPSAMRKDSQGICFLGKIQYNDFIARYLGYKQGDIIEKESGKKLGTHQGFWFHTIGQRKGLGLSGGPWFVVDKDAENNIVYVSQGYDPQSVYGNFVQIKNLSYISKNIFGDLSQETEICFKIRHTPEFSKGVLQEKNGFYQIRSQEPIHGIAPGQFAVIYDESARLCLASGTIITSF